MACLLFPSIAFAQFSGDYQFSIISGVTSNWSGDYIVGSNTVSDVLIIESGAVFSPVNAYIGYGTNATDNLILIDGPGSSLNCYSISIGFSSSGNTLIIDNGAQLTCTFGTLGTDASSSNNVVVVSGSNSVIESASFDCAYGSSNQLIITDGGRVSNSGSPAVANCTVTISDGGQYSTYASFCSSTDVLVTGLGSLWNVYGTCFRMYGSTSVTISNGGQLLVPGLYGVQLMYEPSNELTVADSGVINTSEVSVELGVLNIRGGTINAGSLSQASNTGTVNFSGGLLNVGYVTADKFTVGNGTNQATFRLTGNASFFSHGLTISSNATLISCQSNSGEIVGTISVDPGGTILADCGRTLTLLDSLTNNGVMRVVNGSLLQAYGPVINNGLIDATEGRANFHGALINNGVILTNVNQVEISSITRSGSDIIVQMQSVTNASYQLQITPSLTPPAWTNLGASQSGTGGVLTFTDSGGATNSPGRFYQVRIAAP